MTDSLARPPKWFWWISGFGLVWNLIGVAAFVAQMTMDLASLPDAERLFFESTPLWATAAFGIAVASGVLGCVALLLRKSWAVPMLVLCIGGISVQIFHSLAMTNSIEIFGVAGLAQPIAVFVVAVLLTWFARVSEQRGWMEAGA